MANQAPFYLILLSFLILSSSIEHAISGGIAIYWGETGLESNLTETCTTGNYAIVIIAFHPIFGNVSNYPSNLTNNYNPQYNHHYHLSDEILSCQSQGIKVLVSIDCSKYSLTSSEEAKHKAKYLWDNYLDGNSSSRPFGPAVLDGIDFAFGVGKHEYWRELAKELALYEGPKVYLSAAPRCPFPDPSTMSVLETEVFDYVWVQFYYNPHCPHVQFNVTQLEHFWGWWTSKIPTSKFFFGFPAALEAANYGFLPPKKLVTRVLWKIKASKNYGGVMLWTRYFDQITEYSSSIKRYV